ncbi:hypothetical protein EJ05DRAFT_502596 [Pseudovirgaria hyperparasitica]|uniref:Hydrophobic surface binding protein A n=1 Tax=Pseudovirgaria hyperparasitica TaxID=470096 RepID=A0A6A6W2F3_9PEZI|nr:uncharacterized protein EJ05DRAFT_502596 [Pseudovirgaria hyperparasitica]KAF2756130.1 hypothetical protein EJ05DRAFT_502596 [Pseudovirgaria hyperparasitica]
MQLFRALLLSASVSALSTRLENRIGASEFITDLETYYIRAFTLDLSLDLLNGTDGGAARVTDAMLGLKEARQKLEVDANLMTPLSGADSRAVTKELVSHDSIDTSYIGKKDDLNRAISEDKTTEFLYSIRTTVKNLLPVIQSKVDPADGIAVSLMEQDLIAKIQSAIDV